MKKQNRELPTIISALILTAVIFVLPIAEKAKLFLSVIPYLIVGHGVIRKALKGILSFKVFDENFLMTVATLGAFCLNEKYEAIAVMVLYKVGEMLEEQAEERAEKSIEELIDILPDNAVILKDGKEITVPPNEIKTGDTVIIKAGEKSAVDGTVIYGTSFFNNAFLTGESKPVRVQKGDFVYGGSINQSGVIHIKAEAKCENSAAAKIVKLTKEAVSKKAKTENTVTRLAKIYTPTVVITAILTAVIPSVISGNFPLWLNRALMILLVSCPCALVISVPLSFVKGMEVMSKNGILVKGSRYIETLAKAKTAVFDKTGTLTKGNFAVTKIYPENKREEILKIVFLAESNSTHPIAQSVIKAYKGKTEKSKITSVTEIAGKGMILEFDNKTYFVGSEILLKENGVKPLNTNENGTVVFAADEKECLGFIVLNDELKEDTAISLNALNELSIKRTIILSGDKKKTAEEIAKAVGIKEVYSELLPHEKLQKIEEIKKNGAPVIYCGDGINDVPVIAAADIGVAFGINCSDAAVEQADVVLKDDSILRIPYAVKIARRTVSAVNVNIIFSLGIKFLVMIFAFFGVGNMITAIFADVGVMLLAVLNSLFGIKLKK